MRTINKLNAASVSRLREPGRYPDGLGLILQVKAGGAKSWLFRFVRDGRERWMGLGAVHTVSLAEAREAARRCRSLLLSGVDPIAARRAHKAEARVEGAQRITFKECAQKFIDDHEAAWSNRKHRYQWTASLAQYAHPTIGNLPVSSIDTALIIKTVEPIWKTKTVTAERVRGRIARVLDWATVRGYRSGENPARWKGHLSQLLPAPKKITQPVHFAAMHYSDLPAFMAEVREQRDTPARALEFAILTALRTGEVLKARWDEIDFGAKLWTVPAVRMKSRKEHRVPLSARALGILQSMRREKDNPFVFPSNRPGRPQPLSNSQLLRTLATMGASVTVHGFRSTFRDWAAELTAYPREVAEVALGHAVGSAVERAYQRGDLFEKRRRLMADWARYCETPAGVGAKVLHIGSGA